MKKIILMLTLIMSVLVSANAQVAIEKSKITDNIYVGVGGQVSTPTDLNGVFPLNSALNVFVGKEITPIVGLNVEYTNWFGSHANGGKSARFDNIGAHNAIRGFFLGLNGTINLTNLFLDFQGGRNFEVQTITGLGWGHAFIPHQSDELMDDLCAKTGLNFLFNLSKNRAHSLFIQPAVLWNLTNPGASRDNVAFNKNGSQLALTLGYIYHFKNSNGLHTFKLHDVGALYSELDAKNAQINAMREELAKKPKVVIKEVVKAKDVNVESVYFVAFAQGKSDLTFDGEAILNNIIQGKHVTIIGTASPEGTEERNMELSQERANVVANYLKNRGVIVEDANGVGVQGENSNRLAIVHVTSNK